MVRKHDIPRNIVIDGVNCRVWYEGQPLVCDICQDNHKAADCPLKGKYKRCHEAGISSVIARSRFGMCRVGRRLTWIVMITMLMVEMIMIMIMM